MLNDIDKIRGIFPPYKPAPRDSEWVSQSRSKRLDLIAIQCTLQQFMGAHPTQLCISMDEWMAL